MGRVRKLINVQEKEKRKNNIVIKGMEDEGLATKESVEKFLRDKVGVEVKVIDCRRSGRVIVAMLEREGMKMEVMRNKNKLRGERIFIENDLTWEERKLQERISRWAKEEREKGVLVKVGFARVLVKGMWRKWEEIEEEIRIYERLKERREAESNVEGREKQSFV